MSKIKNMCAAIMDLSLQEGTELSELLKKTLNIEDVGVGSPLQSKQSAGAEENSDSQDKGSSFNLELVGYDAVEKLKVIIAVKNNAGILIGDAKKGCEALPFLIKENLSKQELEEFQKKFEGLSSIKWLVKPV